MFLNLLLKEEARADAPTPEVLMPGSCTIHPPLRLIQRESSGLINHVVPVLLSTLREAQDADLRLPMAQAFAGLVTMSQYLINSK